MMTYQTVQHFNGLNMCMYR